MSDIEVVQDGSDVEDDLYQGDDDPTGGQASAFGLIVGGITILALIVVVAFFVMST